MIKKLRNKCKTPVKRSGQLSKKEISDMIDEGVFDKFILKDIAKKTGSDYKELSEISKGIKKKARKSR